MIAKWRSEKRPYLAQVLVDHHLLSVGETMDLVKGAFRIDPFDPETTSLDESPSELVPDALCVRYDLFPVKPRDRSIEVAMANPVDMEALEQVTWSSGREAVPLYCLPAQLAGLRRDFTRPDALVYDLARQFGSEKEVEVLPTQPEQKAEETEVKAPVIRLVNAIITDAVIRLYDERFPIE